MRRFLVHGLLSVGVVSLLGACGAKSNQGSALKVTNGQLATSKQYPSVVLLYDAKLGAMCTGTFVNETTVISAAHCTEGGTVDAKGNVTGSPLSIISISDLAGGQASLVATATAEVRNIQWDKNGKNVNKYDLSLITFPAGTAKAVSALADASPSAGDDLTIVGYGLNQSDDLSDGSSAGVKRIGHNTVAVVSEGFIQFDGDSETTTANGTHSSASAGDSGGPLFINGKLAGITSGGGKADASSPDTTSLYIDVNSIESQAFLSTHLN
ncbi:MAG: S1 family peptidase [Chitinophagaceae bacterium]|nr:S1 family peptidase [Oligoflexus sp.]